MALRRSQRSFNKAARDKAETNAFFNYQSLSVPEDAEDNHGTNSYTIETSNKNSSLRYSETTAPSQDTSVRVHKPLFPTATEAADHKPDTSFSNHEDAASHSGADGPVYSKSAAVEIATEVKFPFGPPGESNSQRVIGSKPDRPWEELTADEREETGNRTLALCQQLPQTPGSTALLSTALPTTRVCIPQVPAVLYTPLQEGAPSRPLYDTYYENMTRPQKEQLVPFLRQAADRIEKTIANGGPAPIMENLFARAFTKIGDTDNNIQDGTLQVGIDKKERREIKRKLQKEIKKIRKTFGDVTGGAAEPKLLRSLANSFEVELSEEGGCDDPLRKQIYAIGYDNEEEDKTATTNGDMTGNNVAHDEDRKGVADDDEASDADGPYASLDRELTSDEEELARGKNFHDLCSLIGIELVFRVADMEDILELCAVGEDGNVDPKRLHPRIIAAVETKLAKMAKEEENAMKARTAEQRRRLGGEDMIQHYENAMKPEPTGYTGKYWRKLRDTADGGDEEEGIETPELVKGEVGGDIGASGKPKERATNTALDVTMDAPAVPGDRASDTTVLNLMGEDLAAMVIAKSSQSTSGPSVLPVPAEIRADLVEASRAFRDSVKKKTPWDQLRRALALCEQSLGEPLVSYFEKDADFVRNIPTYAKFCLKTRDHCAPKLYDDLRVLLLANSVQRVQKRMRKEIEEESHAHPAFGRDAMDDPIVHRLKTLKRDWPTVEELMEKLYIEWKEGSESTEK